MKNLQSEILAIEKEVDKILNHNDIPLDDLPQGLLARALGTINYQLKVSLGREPIASQSDTELLTTDDLKEIEQIKINKAKSFYRQAILSLIPKIAEALTPEGKEVLSYDSDERGWNACREEINRRKNLLMKND